MKGLHYTILLEEPVLANSLAGDTNSARSLPYIPGGLVRGALIGIHANGSELNAADENFRRLFLNGKTRFLPAYPEVNNKRSLPAPLAWKVGKHAEPGASLYNFAEKIHEAVDMKTVGFDLWALQENNIYSLDQDWNINVHTQRDAVYGRAMGRIVDEDEARGAVFRYEALPAGLRLHGLIVTSRDEDTKLLINLLNDRSLMLGKARTAGYGKAHVEKVEPIKEDWRTELYWPWALPIGDIKSFTLTFLSPALLRDANGQFTLDPLPALKEKGIEVKTDKIFRSAEIVGGFNRTWGMPLPQCWAISAGSVIKFTSDTGVDASVLQTLEETGLGERLAEGFGCVAVDVSQPASTIWKKGISQVPASKSSPKISVSSKSVGDLMLKRLLRRDLDSKVLAFVSKATKDYQGGLTGSQLSRWRIILRSVLGTNNPKEMKRLTDLFNKETERASTSWKKMERVRIRIDDKTPRLTEWLGSALTELDQPWGMLGYKSNPIQQAGSLLFTAGDDITFEYRLRMIDSVLAALAKKNSKDNSKKGGAK